MVIEESDFRLESLSDMSHFWDLELLYTIKPKGGEPREEFKIAAYGIKLETAIDKIINYRIRKKVETTSLENYLSMYKKEKEQLVNILK